MMMKVGHLATCVPSASQTIRFPHILACHIGTHNFAKHETKSTSDGLNTPFIESWAKCIGVSYTSLYVHGKPVQFSCKSCTANWITGGSHFRITMALNYSIWWLVIHCCMAPNSSSPPFGFALNAWMQNEWCTNWCDVVRWSNSHL